MPEPKTPLQQAQRLYENSPLTVARIAALFGVSERSIYRAAQRLKWRPRGTPLVRPGSRTARRFDPAAAHPVAAADLARAFLAQPEGAPPAPEAALPRLWARASGEIAEVKARRARLAEEQAADGRLDALENVAEALVQFNRFVLKKTKGGYVRRKLSLQEEHVAALWWRQIETLSLQCELLGGPPGEGVPNHPSCPGLTRASMRQPSEAEASMDCRVKPGNEGDH